MYNFIIKTTKEISMKKRKASTRITLNIILSCLLIFLGIVGSMAAFGKGYEYSLNIMEESRIREANPNIKQLQIQVDETTTLQDLSILLYEHDFIAHDEWFIIQGKLLDYEHKLIPGTYTLSSNMSNTQILDLLTIPPKQDDTIKVTIPEGFTIPQIATRLAEKGVVSKEEFLKAVNDRAYDYEFLSTVPSNSKYKLEGYLFPDTYIFKKNATPEDVIIKMLNRFQQVTDQYSQYLVDSPYSLHEILTIASIIEQEAKLSEERPIISGVIYNRLDATMKLQMCSTIQYVLEKRKANLSYDDLKLESPYNTYLYSGLPVGPICSPGEEAIKAAILPEQNDYYYFVLKDTSSGSHAFSSTAAGHEQNKVKYQQTKDKNFEN